MRYDFRCKKCDGVFEHEMSLKQYENWKKGKFPMICIHCNNRTSDYERVFSGTVGLKFIGKWYSTTKEY